jgi:hypothetical protein
MKEMVFEKGEEFYNVWTKMVSDEIVSLSMSFSERFVLEEAMKVIEIECVHPGALRIMGHVIYLHMITLVKSNMAFYLERELITREAAKNLDASFQQAVKSLVPHINDCVEALGCVKINNMHAPITRDYVKFYS